MRFMLSKIGVLSACFLMLAGGALAVPIEWSPTAGGNGHFYEKVAGRYTWTQARDLATSRTWQGAFGHLATPTTQAENDWVWQSLASPCNYWIGGYQQEGASEPSGGWTWVTDQEWSYTNWDIGEPNEAWEHEDHLIYALSCDGRWNDRADDWVYAEGFLVEYDVQLATEESVTAWGDNTYGQITVPSPSVDFVAVVAGYYHNLGLALDGSIVSWGRNDYGQCDVASPNAGFVAVAAGFGHSIGLRADGTIAVWGDNQDEQCDVPPPNVDFVAVAAGFKHSLALRTDGSIAAWGWNEYGQCIVPSPNTGFVAVSAGAYHSLGLHSNGSIVAWGSNDFNQCTVPFPNEGFVAIAAGNRHSLGLKVDGSIVAWGENYYGQCAVPSPNTGFVAVAAGDQHGLGLKADGSIIAWGRNDFGQCNVPIPNLGFVAVRGGSLHSLGMREAPFKVTIVDVPDDQGGRVKAVWRRHALDAAAAPVPITSYEVQKLGSDWQTATTVAAALADTYSVVMDTPDILCIGQPAAYSHFRVVARTANPEILCESLPDSGYSIDNLPPDPPQMTLYDGETFRSLAWQNPTAPDFGESCLYRGSEPGFEEGDPLLCSATQYWYQEDHLALYYYHARSFDIHGNASEWSNEVVGQYPTDVPEATITQLRLYPNQPNPFNPMTTIRFDLPEPGAVRLAVYDLAGRLLKVLVGGELAAGSHEAVWDGRDAAGRAMASGSYFARLEAGGTVQVVRMSLIR